MTQTALARARENVILAARRAVVSTSPSGCVPQCADMDVLRMALDVLDGVEAGEITDQPGLANRDAPATARRAASLSGPALGSMRRKIIDEIAITPAVLYGRTIDELEVVLKGSHTTISSAVNHLVGIGWLRDSGWLRSTRGRRDAIVWELTPHARERLWGAEWKEPSCRVSATS